MKVEIVMSVALTIALVVPFLTTDGLVTESDIGKPEWSDIPRLEIEEDTTSRNILNLSSYVQDDDDQWYELTFNVEEQTNPDKVDLRIFDDYFYPGPGCNLSVIILEENWYGEVQANISVTDGEFVAYQEISIDIISVNDEPSVNIISPMEDQSVEYPSMNVTGTAWDDEGITSVKVLFNDTWYDVVGTEEWAVNIDIPMQDDIIYGVPILVRVSDGEFSIDHLVNITILSYAPPPDLDLDDDGYDNIIDDFPKDPNEWADSDRDGRGDNGDAFPLDPTEQDDSDNDGYGDNRDVFPLNKTEWNDTDSDGVGDNSDAFIDDPAASIDTDGDGYPDEWNLNMSADDSTTGLSKDRYPLDPDKWKKTENSDFISPVMILITILVIVTFSVRKRQDR